MMHDGNKIEKADGSRLDSQFWLLIVENLLNLLKGQRGSSTSEGRRYASMYDVPSCTLLPIATIRHCDCHSKHTGMMCEGSMRAHSAHQER